MRVLICSASVALMLVATAPGAQTIDGYNPMPIVYPTSLAPQADGKMIIVGNFSSVGSMTRNGVARLNTDGSVDETFANPNVDSEVKTVAVQPDGKLLIGGSFTSVGGQPRHLLARLNADGSLDTSFADPGFNDTVWTIAVQPDGKILVGGSFTMIGTHAQNYFARLDAAGGFDATFQDPQLCCNPLVNAIGLEPDGHVLLGGAFSQAGGVSHFYFARYSSSGVFDPAFPNSTASIMPGAIMIAPDGSIYVSALGNGIVEKLAADGSPAASFNGAASDGTVNSFALQPNGELLIAGTFQTVGGQARHALARLNADGSLDASFADLQFNFDASNPNAYIYGLAKQADGRTVVIGNFSLINGQPQSYMARVATGDYAISSLVVRGDDAGADVTWYRLGDGPELAQPPTLLHSTDGVNFTALGPMSRVANGWHASANVDVHGARFYLQAIGTTSNGADDAAPGQVASEPYSNDTIFANGIE